jgi:hypothetical protein
MPDYPRIDILVRVGTWVEKGEALVDTGFSGGAIVPLAMIHEIDDDPVSDELRLGNDDLIRAYCYGDGEVTVLGRDFPVSVWALGSDFIIGREVLDQMEICFEFGQRVRIRFSPE